MTGPAAQTAGYTGITAGGAGFTGATPVAATPSRGAAQTAGYTGITAGGAGFTGAAPVAATPSGDGEEAPRSMLSIGYDDVLEPPVLAERSEVDPLVVVDNPALPPRPSPPPTPETPDAPPTPTPAAPPAVPQRATQGMPSKPYDDVLSSPGLHPLVTFGPEPQPADDWEAAQELAAAGWDAAPERAARDWDTAWVAAGARAEALLNAPVTTTGPHDRPWWWPKLERRGGISFELQDAWSLPPPRGVHTEIPLPEAQVLSWLQRHRELIVSAARRFRVDRRAIAGAIAWEALENARTVSLRAVGPAKVHVNADVVSEVEKAGYLPVRTSDERRQLLKTAAGAIEYAAAIMSAKSAIAEALLGDITMRRRPDLLANEYVARSLTEWTGHLANKRDTVLRAEEDMAVWTTRNLPYLERGVGRPAPLDY
jgi:hypothetical protein